MRPAPLRPSRAVPLQDQFAERNTCFGCGPHNQRGLRLKSYLASRDDEPIRLTAEFSPETHHQAFPGVLNGGIIGSLLDCHSAWTAMVALMHRDHLDRPPAVVTASYQVQLTAPTPMGSPVSLSATPQRLEGRRCWVLAELRAGDQLTARCEGCFVAVKAEHPAYHRI